MPATKPAQSSSVHLYDNFTVGQEKSEPFNDLSVYPSPANDAVRITWYKPDTHTLAVFDAQGRIVHMHTNLAPNQRDMVLSVAAWADGLYTVCLTGSSGRTARRFMKN